MIIEISIAVVAVALVVLIIYIIQTLKNLQKNMDKIIIIGENIQQDVHDVLKKTEAVLEETEETLSETKKLIAEARSITENIHHKTQKFDVLFDLIEEITNQVRDVSQSLSKTINEQKDRLNQVFSWVRTISSFTDRFRKDKSKKDLLLE